MKQITPLIILLVLSAKITHAQKVNTCDSLCHKHYSYQFFAKSGIDIKTYKWDKPDVNCNVNQTQNYHSKYVGLTVATGVTLAIGSGLLASGLIWASPKISPNLKIQDALVIAGVGTYLVAVPLFTFHEIYRKKTLRSLQKIHTL